MKKISEKILYEGKWLSFAELKWKHKNSSIHTWEAVKRKITKAIVIIAKLRPSNCYVLIKQFRPATGKYIIEFPAGLVEHDNIEEEALRELLEETGYIGEIRYISPVIEMSPSIIDANFQVAYVDIDENLENNKNPIQHLEGSEDIEVFSVKEEEIEIFLKEIKEENIGIAPSIWYYFSKIINNF